MSGSIKVGGHTVFVHTGASGAGTLSVQGQNGNTLLTDDGTAVHLGNNVRLPASGGIKDSSGNNILTESGGNVSIGNIRLNANSSVRDSSGNAIITDVAGSAVVAPSAGGIPPGAIMSFAMSSAPSGWVVCNGAEYAIADYGDLHTAIGTTWGALTNGSGGAGSTHFRVPDLRGAFLRGIGQHGTYFTANLSGFAGPSVGNFEYDQMQGHKHDFTLDTRSTVGSDPTRVANGAPTTYIGYSQTTSNPVTDSTNGAPRVGDETRPFNAGINYCIKY